MTGFPIAGMIGGPVSGWAMSRLAGVAGLAGWQWLYIVEAAPAVLLGIVTWFTLSDDIERAKWLTEPERDTLRHALRDDGREADAGTRRAVAAGHRRPEGVRDQLRLFHLYLQHLCAELLGADGTEERRRDERGAHWLALGHSVRHRHDRHGADLPQLGQGFSNVAGTAHWRPWRSATALSLLPLLAHDLTATIVLLTIASTTVFVTIPLLWSLASDYFAGSPAAAPAIAFVNSLGLLGGFASPFAMGWLKTLSGTLNSGLFLMTTLLALGACAMLCVRVGRARADEQPTNGEVRAIGPSRDKHGTDFQGRVAGQPARGERGASGRSALRFGARRLRCRSRSRKVAPSSHPAQRSRVCDDRLDRPLGCARHAGCRRGPHGRRRSAHERCNAAGHGSSRTQAHAGLLQSRCLALEHATVLRPTGRGARGDVGARRASRAREDSRRIRSATGNREPRDALRKVRRWFSPAGIRTCSCATAFVRGTPMLHSSARRTSHEGN